MLLKSMGVKIGVFWVLLSTFVLNSVNAQYAPIRFTLPRLPHSEISKTEFFGNPPLEGNEPSISINPNDANDIWLAFNNNKPSTYAVVVSEPTRYQPLSFCMWVPGCHARLMPH
jgi:hypothetical protein